MMFSATPSNVSTSPVIPARKRWVEVISNAALARTLLNSCKLSKASGSFNVSGNAYVTNFKWSAKHDDKQDFTCSLRITGTATAADS